MGWLRTSKNSWQQYVGRRVVRIVGVSNSPPVYLAYVGNVSCGRHSSLKAAQDAVSKKWG